MKIITIIISLLFFGCNTLRHNNSKLSTYNFNGQVYVNIGENLAKKVNKIIPVKAELCLMKQDSTVIMKTMTDSIGGFNIDISIKREWNPLLLKITGLENPSLDTVVFGERIWNTYYCAKTENVNLKSISIISNEKKIIEIDCVSLDRDIAPRQY